MSQPEILFGAASIATVLWTSNGFIPNSTNGVVDTGLKLVKHFNDRNIIDGIIKKMPDEIQESIKASPELIFNDSRDNENIEIVELHNLSYKLYNIKKFNTKLYVCNKEQNRRAKIVVLENLDFKDTLYDPIKLSTTINTVLEFQKSVAEYVFSNIPKQFELGDLYYKSNIVSIESNDKEIDGIIDSIYDIQGKKFRKAPKYKDITDKKLIDTYYVLLSHQDLISKNINEKLIRDEIVEHKVKQSNMILYQENGGKIPTKTVNYEVEPNHRIITSLTKPYSVPLVTNRLLWDYLSLT